MDFLFQAFSLDWRLAVIDLLRVTIAFALAVPIGWERHRSERSLGLRTFPIVAMAACGFMLILNQLPGSNAEIQARLIQGLITGIGFIGGGAILKEGTNVRGLATASSIWCTGAIGAAVGFGRIDIGIILSLVMFVSLRILTPVVATDEYGNNKTSKKEENKDSENKEE